MKKLTATQRIEQAVEEHDNWMCDQDSVTAIKLIRAERARLKRGVTRLPRMTYIHLGNGTEATGVLLADVLALWEG